MQKRKIEDSEIWKAYNRIMSGESLTTVATAVGLNRGTLRKYIDIVVEPNLSENDRLEFKKIITKNFRGTSTEGKRKNRNGKRKKAEQQINESEQVRILAEYGITPEQIDDLYKRLRGDSRTVYARDTFIYKCVEHVQALRAVGFSVQEIFTIFYKRPKLFSGNSDKMINTYKILLELHGNPKDARTRMVEDPWIDFKISGRGRRNEGEAR